METAASEQLLVSTVCRERLIVELLPVNKFRLVDEDMVEREGVGSSAAVLRDDVEVAAIIEGYGIFPVHGLEMWFLPMQRLPRFFANDVVDVTLVTPLLQVHQSRGENVGLASLDRWRHHAQARTWHVLHGIEDAASLDHTFSGTTAPLADQRLRHELQDARLHVVEK